MNLTEWTNKVWLPFHLCVRSFYQGDAAQALHCLSYLPSGNEFTDTARGFMEYECVTYRAICLMWLGRHAEGLDVLQQQLVPTELPDDPFDMRYECLVGT